jgi:hypothetical protein
MALVSHTLRRRQNRKARSSLNAHSERPQERTTSTCVSRNITCRPSKAWPSICLWPAQTPPPAERKNKFAKVSVFKIVRLMPEEFQAIDWKYRVKSAQEGFERTVLECDLSPSIVPEDTYEDVKPRRRFPQKSGAAATMPAAAPWAR